MEYIKLIMDTYGYRTVESSGDNIGMVFIFLSTDVGSSDLVESKLTWKHWILDDSLGEETSGNITRLEKEGDYIYISYISCMYDEDNPPTRLKVSRTSLIDLLRQWNEKVCKKMPNEVTITYDNECFLIETSAGK